MKEFTITEDFPKSEIEFDMRFFKSNFLLRLFVFLKMARWLCLQEMWKQNILD